MNVYFDNVLEFLTEDNDNKELYNYLSELKKDLLAAEICPRGELERSYMCRQFLRDSTNKVCKKVKGSGMQLDSSSLDIMEQTIAFIEVLGNNTELERVIIVIRNLLIIMENLALLQDDRKLPIRTPGKKSKKEFSIVNYNITETGKEEFLKTVGIPTNLEKEDLLKPLINEKVMKAVNKAKLIANELEGNAIEERYRTIFFYLAISEVFRKENVQ